MMWFNGWTMGWGMWLLVGLGTLGFWVLVAIVVRALVIERRNGSPPAPSDPLQLLDARLARGEMGVEEYEQRRRLLVDGH